MKAKKEGVKKHAAVLVVEKRIAIVDGILAKVKDGGLDLTEDEAMLITGVLTRYKGKLIERWL
jgi:hypothetical protein